MMTIPVLFWEQVAEAELAQIARFVEGKQSRLNSLRATPFDAMTGQKQTAMNALDREIQTCIALIGWVERMRDVYRDFTGSVAEKLVRLEYENQSLQIENKQLKRQNNDLTHRNAFLEDQFDFWVNRYFKLKTGNDYESL